MSNQLRVRKPKAILFDIFGTIIMPDFVDQEVEPYLRNCMNDFLVDNWDNLVVMHDVERLRAESAMDGGPAIVHPSLDPDTIRRSVVDYVTRCIDEDRVSDAILVFRYHMLFNGLDLDHLKTPVYSDAALCLGYWATHDIKLYVYSHGWKVAMQKLLQKTHYGDISLAVEDYFDTEMGPLNDAESYKAIVNKLGYPAEDILYITNNGPGVQGIAAHHAGLSVVLVSFNREELRREGAHTLPLIRSFDKLLFACDGPAASTMGSSVDYVSPSHTSTAKGDPSMWQLVALVVIALSANLAPLALYLLLRHH